ncbi:MAG: hypothetical protein M3220_14185 [Chloroflexota bacterium]|nr:hypothetical protein [Chloroflexota bacterium]
MYNTRRYLLSTLLIILTMLLVACADTEEEPLEEEGVTSETPLYTVAEISEGARPSAGGRVLVAGQVNRVIAPNAFTIGGEAFAGGGEVLVVTGQPIPVIDERPEGPIEEDLVLVEGLVQEFDLATFEETVGQDLDDARFAEFEGTPAIISQEVRLTPRIPGVGPVEDVD